MPGVHIERFIAGLHTNRAPIATPFRSSYGHVIEYKDALWGGLNVELTPKNTLARRPGWTAYSSGSYSGTANGIAGADLSSTLHVLLSTSTNVYDVTTGACTSIYTKGTTAQTFFQQVGNYLFMSDGNANLKYDGTSQTNNVTNNGVAAPTSAPYIPKLNLYDTVGATQTTHAWVPGAVYTNSTASAQTYFLLAPTLEIYATIVPPNATLTSQTSAPNWASQYGVIGGTVTDGQITWTNSGTIGTWQANKGSSVYFNSSYVHPGTFSAVSTTVSSVSTSGGSSVANWAIGPPGYAYISNGTGTGASNLLNLENLGFSLPANAVVTGIAVQFQGNASQAGTVTDAAIQLVKAGTAVGSAKQQGQWFYSHNNSTFGTRNYGSNTDLWGTTWLYSDINNSGFGVQISVDLATSALVGVVVQNLQVTIYYTVSSWTGIYTASVILDSNGNLQRVKVLGTTGGSAPSWATTIGATTTDNTMTWECLGSGNELPVLFADTYAYGFRTMSAHLSTMSPTLVVQAPIIGTSVAVSGVGSNDTQVVTVELYRTPDGGSLLLYDRGVPNVNASTTWTIYDTTLDTNLNALLIGPVAHANDPPPSGMTVLAYHMGRLWGIVGNLLYFSAGPDCTNGDGNQAWPPANVFTLTSPGTALAPTTQGLVVCTGIDISVVLGGPQLNTFWLQPLFKNLGVQSPNCLTQDGDNILMFTSQQQFISLSAAGRDEIGFTVADKLASTFTAGSSYIAAHRAGQDQGIFISDGSTNQMRYNMNAETWDPVGQPATGIGPLASVDTSVGTRRLLSASGGSIYYRNTSAFSDNGTAYAANGVIGSIVLSQGGEKTASITSLVLQGPNVGTQPTIGVLCNEMSGSFTNIPYTKADPPQLPATTTMMQNAYDWKGVQSMLPDLLRHIQIQVTFSATDTVQNEIYTVSLV